MNGRAIAGASIYDVGRPGAYSVSAWIRHKSLVPVEMITPKRIEVLDDPQPQEFGITLDAKSLQSAIQKMERGPVTSKKTTK